MTYEGRPVSLQLWNLGGQDHFRFMLPSYGLGAKGAILLYDTTRTSTLDSLEEWAKICHTHNRDLPILFDGTKTDLVEQRCISAARARSLLEPLNLFDHIEVSVKAGANVERAFEMIVAKIIHPDRSFIPQVPDPVGSASRPLP